MRSHWAIINNKDRSYYLTICVDFRALVCNSELRSENAINLFIFLNVNFKISYVKTLIIDDDIDDHSIGWSTLVDYLKIRTSYRSFHSKAVEMFCVIFYEFFAKNSIEKNDSFYQLVRKRRKRSKNLRIINNSEKWVDVFGRDFISMGKIAFIVYPYEVTRL